MLRHILLLPFLPLIGLAIFAVAVFEIWMLVDVVTNPRLQSLEKLLWVIGMLIFHPFVAIAYFFISRSGLDHSTKRLKKG